MTIVGRPPRRRPCAPDCAKTCAAARPSFSAVSAVTGSMFAIPRTPSVPKILRACSAAAEVAEGLLWLLGCDMWVGGEGGFGGRGRRGGESGGGEGAQRGGPAF